MIDTSDASFSWYVSVCHTVRCALCHYLGIISRVSILFHKCIKVVYVHMHALARKETSSKTVIQRKCEIRTYHVTKVSQKVRGNMLRNWPTTRLLSDRVQSHHVERQIFQLFVRHWKSLFFVSKCWDCTYSSTHSIRRTEQATIFLVLSRKSPWGEGQGTFISYSGYKCTNVVEEDMEIMHLSDHLSLHNEWD